MKPNKLSIANLPTKIEALKTGIEGYELYIKRDDQTGSEFSGNKIRKLEFAVQEALAQDARVLITCGGVQSNHARATAALAVRLGLECHLFLRTDQRVFIQGNHLLDRLLGAKIHFITAEEYRHHRQEYMEKLQDELAQAGKKAYLIPEGASNAIGTFGYFHAFSEILSQEKEMGISFDTLVCAVGSGGTYAGLVFGNAYHRAGKRIIGINICDSAQHFREVTLELKDGFVDYLGEDFPLEEEDLLILDGHVGRGYALNTPEEMDFIRDFARKSGVIVDPVYTGKTMKGLIESLTKQHPYFEDAKRILFIHTGGLFGLFAKAEEFSV